jgi:NAD(P)-dependent dehydrogenase (short-subunit alcohol dehydrogenase family)
VPLLLHYVSSKGAVLAMTISLAKELGGRNILVNAVAPGFTLSAAVLENEGQMQRSREISMQGRAIPRDQFPEDVVWRRAVLCPERCVFHYRPNFGRQWRNLPALNAR